MSVSRLFLFAFAPVLLLVALGTTQSVHPRTPLEIVASGEASDAEFGWSVAGSGDIAVVGAPFGSAVPGAAFVFTNVNGRWVQSAQLTASDGAAWDAFGISVAISEDTIVVGAPEHQVGGNSQQGAIYVFVRPPSGWVNMTETAELTASDGLADDRLGFSVAMQRGTVVSGAANATLNGNTYQGAAYVFVQPITGWVTTSTYNAKLTASDGSFAAHFGWSAAMSGSTVVIGAYDAGGCGHAYVFVEPPSGWSDGTQTAELSASDGVSYDNFGWSVAIYGDTIGVGANQFSSGAGKAYVFEKPVAGWTNMSQTAELTPSDNALGEDFGVSVAVSNNFLIAGATYGSSSRGSACVFFKPAGGWVNATPNAKLSPSSSSYNFFGQSIFIHGTTAFVGAPFAKVNGNYEGAVYVFSVGK